MEIIGRIFSFFVLAALSLVATYKITLSILFISMCGFLTLRFKLKHPRALEISVIFCAVMLLGWLMAIWVFDLAGAKM